MSNQNNKDTFRVPTDLQPGEYTVEQDSAFNDEEMAAAKQAVNLSQWQLIRLRFSKHRLAVISMYFLILIYGIAAMAEFFTPNDSQKIDTRYIYAPPQIPKWSFSNGIHVNEVERVIDPFTLKNSYIQTDRIIPLRFFTSGSSYKLFGLIPTNLRFLGVDENKWLSINSDQLPPGAVEAESLLPPTWYFMGADQFGRDVFSRLIFGARISLSIGLIAIIIMFLLGTILGGISGYVGGSVDNLIQRSIEIINSFPHLPLWLAFVAILPADWSAIRTYFAITIVLSLLGWTGLGRVVRGKILSLREEDYAVAARLLGATHGRVIFRHLVPGFTSHIIVTLTLSVPAMILGETALSFLGLGLRPPVVSWGVMLQDCMSMDVLGNYPWLLMPVILIILTVLAFNFVGDGMRDAADPYSSK